jgi:hypothetical protein
VTPLDPSAPTRQSRDKSREFGGRPATLLSEALEGEAKDAYDQTNGLIERNEFSGAFTLYHRAYELAPDARQLWNMGRVEYLRERFAAARA